MTRLDPRCGVKPLDFGANGVTGSIDADGRIIALNSYHPRHGYVTLTSAEPFPEDRRYDPAAVRAYRQRLARLSGFGLRFNWPVARREGYLEASYLPVIRHLFEDDGEARITTFGHGAGAVQLFELSKEIPVWWEGRLSLQRCAYTQLTEGGPLPETSAETRASFEGGILILENPALGWAAAVAGFAPHDQMDAVQGETLALSLPLDFRTGQITIAYAFGATGNAAAQAARELHSAAVGADLYDATRTYWRGQWQSTPDDPILRRALGYGTMLAIPVGETTCLLTDHMLLPLSWNRDAYYLARAFLKWNTPAALDIVRRHLLWMFEQAERVDGFWGRSYRANGQVKDQAFQLDQQLFPLLELAEYVVETRDRDTLNRLTPGVTALVERLMARQSADTRLFSTEETPADDPITLPYHLSSHILFWRVAMRMQQTGISGAWQAQADTVRAAVQRHFIGQRAGARLYAYATDGRGQFHFYHDANDFPLVLAPAWGFVAADDPVWRATIHFAFSSANEAGVYQGRLGSVHTRAPWALGDVQEMIVARACSDSAREAAAGQRLQAAAQWDGGLPEAYDADTGEVVSRHWFAWPNAAYACFALGTFDR